MKARFHKLTAWALTLAMILTFIPSFTLEASATDFTVPEGAASITGADITEVNSAITYTVTVTNDGNGTASAEPTSGAEGTEVTLTATPSEGYQFKEWEVISGGVTVENDKFTIGTANVEIKAVFEAEPTTTNVASVTINGVTTEYATLKEAFTAASYKTATITLLRDYDVAYETSQPYTTGGATVTTFDLGGHTLSYTNLVPGSYTSRNPAFAGTCTVQNGTIETDNRYFALSAYSSYSCAMSIKGNVIINTTNEYGNAVGVTANTTLIIESGASITSNNSDNYTGGAICVYDGGKVILNGGNVVNNGTAPAIAPFNGQSGTTVVVNGGTAAKIKAANVYFNVDNAANVTGNAWYKLTNSIPDDKATVAYTANTTVYEDTTYGLGGAAVTLTAASASGVTVSKILANDTEATLFEGVYSFTMPNNLVTLTAETGVTTPQPIITCIEFNSESPAYDEETNTFYVSDSNPFVLTITGENLTLFNGMGGLEALFKREISNAGWAVTNVNIQSDTVAHLSINTFSLTYILNDPLGSRKATAVMVENGNTQYGNTIYVNIMYAPTYELKIIESVGGTVSHNHIFSNYIAEGANVTLTVTPDNGYGFESLTVDGVDVTEQVSGGTYTFTMPAGNVTVSATFKAITANVRISAVDVADGEEIAGATIQVLDSEDNVVDEWTSTTQAHEISGLTIGEEYTLRATVAPNGYTIPTDTTFIIDDDGHVLTTGSMTVDGTILVEFDKTVVRISAVDVADGEEIAGATIQVLDSEDNVVEEWTSTTQAHEISGLTTSEEYTLRTTVAPNGYTIPTDTMFTIDENGHVLTTGSMTVDGTILVELDKTVVRISAVDVADGEEIAGAHLQILDRMGDVVKINGNLMEWDCGSQVKIIRGLKTGVAYTLHTTVAPDGYTIPTDTEFAINESGNVTYTCSTTTDGDGNIVLLVEFESNPEVLWGTSAENLTNSGTWSEFNKALSSDNTIAYVKANMGFTLATTTFIDRKLTFDLAGCNVISEKRIFNCGDGCALTIIDSADTDGTITFNNTDTSIYAGGGTVKIEGGKFVSTSDSPFIWVQDAVVTVNGGEIIAKGTGINFVSGTVNVTGGSITSVNTTAVFSSGNTTVTGDAVIKGKNCDIEYNDALLELSGWKNAAGKQIYNRRSVTVSDSTIKLPQGYSLLDANGIAQTELLQDTTYTVGTVSTYTVTFVDWDDAILGTDTVEKGKPATAPANPTREGWKFTGWDTAFDNVTGNLTVKAQYVEKATITIDMINQHCTYDGTAKAFVIKGTALIGFIVKYQQNGQDITPKNVGNYDVIITRAEDDTHKKFEKTLQGGLVIEKVNASISVDTTPIEKFYGETVTLPTATTNFGTVTVDKIAAEMKNKGTYTVTYTVAGTNNYDGDTKTVNVTIKQLPVNITWENADGLIYDGNQKEIRAVLANRVTGDNITLTVAGTTSATEKGTYTATVTAIDNDNYTITGGTNLTKEWAISETANEWTTALSITGWTFGEVANTPQAEAKFGTAEFTYSDSVDGAYTDTVPVNAGTYYVKATVPCTISYAEITDTKEFVIEAKELNADNITAIESETYTGGEIKPAVEVKDGETLLVLGTDYEITYQNNVNAGTAKLLVTLKGNYKGNCEKEFTILKKQIDSAITLTAPVKNAAPQREITGDGYTATVVWSPEVTDKFGYNTEYTATITITVDENHTVTGIAANGYTVEGAKTVTNDENSNVVTVAYYKTGSRPSSGGSGGTTCYTVKFDTNGGSTITSKTVTRNSAVTEPTAPTKEGYTFNGWYTNEELTTAYDFDSKVTKNITLYAKWEKHDDDDSHGIGTHDCPSLAFDDLDITQWYHLDTDYVIEKDIFRGTAETTFTPNGNITRAMMITVLYRAEGEPEVTGEATFEDIDENAYYAKAIVWGQQNGIIKGYSETEYAPEQDILREQIAAIMYRYAKFKGYDVSVGENTNILSYNDYDSISEYAVISMQWAVGSGMIKGRTESTLNPLDNATRAEVAAILHRFIEANK